MKTAYVTPIIKYQTLKNQSSPTTDQSPTYQLSPNPRTICCSSTKFLSPRKSHIKPIPECLHQS